MSAESDIWAVLDERAGHRTQVLGLCEALDRPYHVKQLSFNAFSSLPAIEPVKASLFGVSNKDILSPPWPKLAIAAGRRTLPVMRYIKKQSPATKLIQLMWPGSIEPFDLIITPEHDHPPNHPKVIQTVGALHTITEQSLSDAGELWKERWSSLPTPWTGLLLGGKSKYGSLKTDDIDQILAHTQALQGEGSLLITTSRRTPDAIIAYLEQQLRDITHFLHDYRKAGDNPYQGILALGDRLIISGDSISMVSEACYTGKLVHIYDPPQLLGPKHRDFLHLLYQNGYACSLGSNRTDFTPKTLDERERIVSIINELTIFQ